MSKLPKPNVVVALNEEKAHQMTAAHIRGIICNPIYAGITLACTRCCHKMIHRDCQPGQFRPNN